MQVVWMSVHFACNSWLGAVPLGAQVLHLLFYIISQILWSKEKLLEG